jgi:hypothetical protein
MTSPTDWRDRRRACRSRRRRSPTALVVANRRPSTVLMMTSRGYPPRICHRSGSSDRLCSDLAESRDERPAFPALLGAIELTSARELRPTVTRPDRSRGGRIRRPFTRCTNWAGQRRAQGPQPARGERRRWAIGERPRSGERRDRRATRSGERRDRASDAGAPAAGARAPAGAGAGRGPGGTGRRRGPGGAPTGSGPLSTGRAARGTWAVARPRRRPGSPARRRRRAAIPGPG